jgi:hypothetical protein
MALLLGVLPDDLRNYHLRRWPPWSIAGTVTRMTEHPRIVLPAGAIAFAVNYVLSYAPTEQSLAAGRLPWPRAMMDFYVPVQWLIDQSPLREPLLRWADIHGQARELRLRVGRPQQLLGDDSAVALCDWMDNCGDRVCRWTRLARPANTASPPSCCIARRGTRPMTGIYPRMRPAYPRWAASSRGCGL